MNKFRINGIGCSLMDFLYTGIDFKGEAFVKYHSLKNGDGGLNPGGLVFAEEFEKFSGNNIDQMIKDITGGKVPDKHNIGGPAIVALIHAAQMLRDVDVDVSFYGLAGSDMAAGQLFSQLSATPVNTSHYLKKEGVTPYTIVLSDQAFHEGKGERAFINHIGVAWDYNPFLIDSSFFSAGITVFGGTALVPHIHDHLHELLAKAREHGAVTVVNTVYDFRNEKSNPGKPWPLGDSGKSYPLIDLLIVDREEALKITASNTKEEAADFLMNAGAGAFVITDGANPVMLFSGGSLFKELPLTMLPVSDAVARDAESRKKGDTTGCGDNFAGGMIASIARQLIDKKTIPDLKEAACQGIVSGGFACFYLGGTYMEDVPGEKSTQIKKLYDQYIRQIGQ
jgi:sugar/nucleoside kinase (ribokinase family)